ncbi:MAG: phosphate ABC transporter substrate-binding protein [Nitrospirota bacterium]
MRNIRKATLWVIEVFVLTGVVLLVFPSVNYGQGTSRDINRENASQKTIETKPVLKWVGCGVTKEAFMHELAVAYTKKTGVRIQIEGGGATRGIRDTAALKSDMGGSCRHILPIAEEENVRLIQVAWDALVVIVNRGNPVSGITIEQLKSILKGGISNWKDLGGPDRKIKLVIREQGPGGKISGVGMMTRELVFFDREMDYTDDAIKMESSGPLEEYVQDNDMTVGITGVSSARRRNVKLLHLNGVAPTYENIASGRYPLFRPLYLVLPKKTNGKRNAEDFVSFVLSDEGQEILKLYGTVTLEDGAGLWKKYRDIMFKAGVRMGEY